MRGCQEDPADQEDAADPEDAAADAGAADAIASRLEKERSTSTLETSWKFVSVRCQTEDKKMDKEDGQIERRQKDGLRGWTKDNGVTIELMTRVAAARNHNAKEYVQSSCHRWFKASGKGWPAELS